MIQILRKSKILRQQGPKKKKDIWKDLSWNSYEENIVY